MKIQNTSFNPEAVKSMGFPAFKKNYSKVLRGDLQAHFEAITGEKVKANKPKSKKEGE